MSKPDRVTTTLKRIETILLKIADQMELDRCDVETTLAIPRRTRRHSCLCHGGETVETRP